MFGVKDGTLEVVGIHQAVSVPTTLLQKEKKTERIFDYPVQSGQQIHLCKKSWNTYHQVITELSPKEWIYNDFTTYVITHNEKASSEKIRFTNMNPVDLIKRLKKEDGKDIWICGGANLVQQLVNEDLIDCYYITIIPTLLGSGIRLFENVKQEIKLRLLNTKSYNGMTDLIYARR